MSFPECGQILPRERFSSLSELRERHSLTIDSRLVEAVQTECAMADECVLALN